MQCKHCKRCHPKRAAEKDRRLSDGCLFPFQQRFLPTSLFFFFSLLPFFFLLHRSLHRFPHRPQPSQLSKSPNTTKTSNPYQLQQCRPALRPLPLVVTPSRTRSTSVSAASGKFRPFTPLSTQVANPHSQLQLALPQGGPHLEPAHVHLPHVPCQRARLLLLCLPAPAQQPSRGHRRCYSGCRLRSDGGSPRLFLPPRIVRDLR